MESPVRSVEASAGSGEKGEDSAGPKGEPPASHRFEAKSYLERQVEELSCADEDEAQEKVSKRLQLKQERAKKKRLVKHYPVPYFSPDSPSHVMKMIASRSCPFLRGASES